ncbi:MAG: tryptophanase [bacterium]|nr:tryptophanase [bacterium]
MRPEPFKIKMVEPIRLLPKEEREKKIAATGYNLFGLRSEDVFIDLLSDSGTGSMSNKQWSALMLGDESYAGASSFYKLEKAVQEILGFPYVLPTHQGRAAENVLHSVLVKEGDVVPGNTHFDTTKAHIEFRRATALDCTIEEAFNPTMIHPFKGNVDLEKLKSALNTYVPQNKVPFVLITVTCNSAGGQPVALSNIKAVKELCEEYQVPLFIDAARFAENAKFIQLREEGYRNKSVKEIVVEMFQYADGCTMSAKKDPLVNIGGFIAFRDSTLYQKCSVFAILFEGFLTYGGMSGRDMEALAAGLEEAINDDYLEYRLAQTSYLGEQLLKHNIPIVQPIGGHAVYVDALSLLPHIEREHLPAQSLAVELYIESGVRGVEIGTVLADRDPITRENRYPRLELVRLSIPRRVYTNNHMDWVVEGFQKVVEKKDQIRGLKFVYETPILRHFTAKFEKV